MVIAIPDPDAPVRRPDPIKVAEVPTWRRLSLVAVIAALIHAQLYPIGEQLAARGAVIVPATLRVVVLLGLLGYAIYQNAASQRFVQIYDRVSRHLVVIAVLASMQLLTAQRSLYLATATDVVLAIVAGAAYLRIHAGSHSRWIGLPFAVLAGYASFVAVGGLDASIALAGCPSIAPTIALLLGLGMITMALSLRASDPALPALVGWLATTIVAADHAVTNVQGAALLAAGSCVATAGLIVMTRVVARAIPEPHRRSIR
ncbi:MAG: hypothetical protein WKG01_34885 [Kofleriaceae bacterium]